MQAHPLSSTAARIPTLDPTPLPTRTAEFLSHLQPQTWPHSLPYAPIAGHAGLAHDARNLLAALRLYCDLLGMPGVLAPEHRHYAADLDLIAARSSDLVLRLLQTATTQDGTGQQPASGTAEPTSARQPADVLRSLAPVLERIAAGAARVSVSVPTPLPAVALPAEALERITVNLVRNAAEAIRSSRPRGLHTPPGHIRIALEHSASALRLTVEDNGPGMPPAVAAAFLRPSPLPDGAVRGLGHRIIHELATETGAALSIRVRPGRGTSFGLRWPLPEGLQHPGHTLEPLHRNGPATATAGDNLPC